MTKSAARWMVGSAAIAIVGFAWIAVGPLRSGSDSTAHESETDGARRSTDRREGVAGRPATTHTSEPRSPHAVNSRSAPDETLAGRKIVARQAALDLQQDPVGRPGDEDLERLRAEAEPVVEFGDWDEDSVDLEMFRDPDEDSSELGALSDWDVQALVEQGDEQSYATLHAALFDPKTNLDTKQDVLANIEEMVELDHELIRLLHQVIEDEAQPAKIRVQALSRLSDFGFEEVREYREHDNEDLASEVDLLDRIEAYKRQQERAAES
jgi:hypothetical protein